MKKSKEQKAIILDHQNKILEALKQVPIKLIEDKKRINGKIAIYQDGEIKILDASQL